MKPSASYSCQLRYPARLSNLNAFSAAPLGILKKNEVHRRWRRDLLWCRRLGLRVIACCMLLNANQRPKAAARNTLSYG